MCDSSIVPLVTTLLSAASTGAGIYNTVQQGNAAKDSFRMPTPTPMDTAPMIRSQVPVSKANAAANLGGGFAPEFLASMSASDAGFPGQGLELLEELRRSLRPENA